jgi:hypothetical protein
MSQKDTLAVYGGYTPKRAKIDKTAETMLFGGPQISQRDAMLKAMRKSGSQYR